MGRMEQIVPPGCWAGESRHTGGTNETWLGTQLHTCNPSVKEAEAGEPGVPREPGLHLETLKQ